MRPKAKVLASRTLYRGQVFDVRRDKVIEPGGVRATRDLVVHRGSVVVLPVTRDEKIILVRQYRHTVGDFLWELVAGRMEPGERPLAGAQRELLEETGYSARLWQRILDVFPTPGFVSERMVVFVARDLKSGKAHPEDDERITTRAFSVRELERSIRSGGLRDAKSVAGVLYYSRFCAKKGRR